MNEEELYLETHGYSQYLRRLSEKTYVSSTLEAIVLHKASVLRKHEGEDKTIKSIMGLGYSKGLLFPIDFDGTVVDADDVFAACYYDEYNPNLHRSANEEFILFVLFTNDPYLPVLPAVYVQKYSVFDRLKKKKKNDFVSVLSNLCPNIKYPVCPIEQMGDFLESEHSVRGKISKTLMKEQLYDATNQFGLFAPDTISSEFGEKTRMVLSKAGVAFHE